MVLKIQRWFWLLLMKYRLWHAFKNHHFNDSFDVVMFKIRHTPRKLFESNRDYEMKGNPIELTVGFTDPAHYLKVGDDMIKLIKQREYLPTKDLEHVYNRQTVYFKDWLENGSINFYNAADVAIYVFTIMEELQSLLKEYKDKNDEMYHYYQRRLKGFLDETDNISDALMATAYQNE